MNGSDGVTLRVQTQFVLRSSSDQSRWSDSACFKKRTFDVQFVLLFNVFSLSAAAGSDVEIVPTLAVIKNPSFVLTPERL